MIHLKDFFNPFSLVHKLTFFLGGGKPPPAPDYVGAANAQGKYNLLAALQTGMMNNPNVVNPFGTQEVTWAKQTNDKGKTIGYLPTIKQKLSEIQQRLLDKGQESKLSLADAGISGSKNVAELLKSGLDFSSLPGAPKNSGQRRDDVINAMMSRVNTDIGTKRDQANSDLIAAGIRPGTKAYDAQMELINRQENDARQQAILAGGQEATRDFGLDSQARQQALAEMLTQRQTPINEINALQSGSQIDNPFAGGLGYNGAGNVQPTPIANAMANQGQAAINQYNAQQAFQNSNINAGAGLLGSLGSAWLMRPGA